MRDGGASEGISGSSPPSPGPEGWVLYDGSCGICRHWIQSRENLLRRHGFAIAPLQAGWVAERLHLQEDNLLQDVRLLLADGRQIQGPDVYRYLMKRVLWRYPLHSIGPTGVLLPIAIRCPAHAVSAPGTETALLTPGCLMRAFFWSRALRWLSVVSSPNGGGCLTQVPARMLPWCDP
jgi:predicted DCC family thiol-disulfide oxidoreductase YuxK